MISLNNLYHIIVTSGVHAIMFIIFLTILYFTIIIKTEQNILTDFVINGAKSYNLDKIGINNSPKYKSFMKLLKTRVDMEQKSFESNNNNLKVKAFMAILIAIAIFIGFIYLLPKILKIKNLHLDYHEVIYEGLILIVVVGLYEYLFLKYIVVEYSFYSFNNAIKDYLNKNAESIKKYLPSILLHFIYDVPDINSPLIKYGSKIVTKQITNKAMNIF